MLGLAGLAVSPGSSQEAAQRIRRTPGRIQWPLSGHPELSVSRFLRTASPQLQLRNFEFCGPFSNQSQLFSARQRFESR